MPHKFFVYGTLKVGGYYSELFNEVRRSSVSAVLEKFDMYNLGPFPAIVRGNGVVHGELHEYDNEEEVLKAIDRIEGFCQDDPKASLYVRRNLTVKTYLGEQVKAFVYVFNDKLTRLARLVEDGVWKI